MAADPLALALALTAGAGAGRGAGGDGAADRLRVALGAGCERVGVVRFQAIEAAAAVTAAIARNPRTMTVRDWPRRLGAGVGTTRRLALAVVRALGRLGGPWAYARPSSHVSGIAIPGPEGTEGGADGRCKGMVASGSGSPPPRLGPPCDISVELLTRVHR